MVSFPFCRGSEFSNTGYYAVVDYIIIIFLSSLVGRPNYEP